MAKVTTTGELGLIEQIRTGVRTSNSSVRLGIGDDCAVLRPARGYDFVFTTDWCLEGRHFRRDWHTAESVGHRCLARGLSDIAAMGAKPVAAFLSLALPTTCSARWFKGFLEGFQGLAEAHGLQLAGGDTSEAPGNDILADVMVVGTVPRGTALLRSGARVGDGIYVSGTLGGSAVELAHLASGKRFHNPGFRTEQTFPEPRVALGLTLRKRYLATACMDLSDGLSTDLGHLCRASGVRAAIDLAALPIASGASQAQALHGGEDYELLFTARPSTKMPGRLAKLPLTRIGTVIAGLGPVVEVDGVELKAGGWQHFRKAARFRQGVSA